MWHLLKDMRKKDKGLAFLAILLIAGQVFLDLKLPDYTKEITVLVSSESNVISDYLLSGGKMLACALGSALLAVIVGYLAAKIAADFSHNVRGKVFHKVFDFALENGFSVHNLSYSPIKGPEGNIEYLVYIEKNSESKKEETIDVEAIVEAAHTSLS